MDDSEPRPKAEQVANLLSSHVVVVKAMSEPLNDMSPTGNPAGRDTVRKKGRVFKLEHFKKLNSVAATLIVFAGFSGLVMWEMTRKEASEAEFLGEQRSTGYAYPRLVSHEMADTIPASGSGETSDSGAVSIPSLVPPPYQASPYPLGPGAEPRIRFVPVPAPRSARFDDFADIPDHGGSSDPSAGDEAELAVIEARVRSQLIREEKMPPEPGSIEDFRQRIETGKNALVKFVSEKGAWQ